MLPSSRKWLFVLALLLPGGWAPLAAPGGRPPVAPVARPPKLPLYDPDVVLVKFRKNATRFARLNTLARRGLTVDPREQSPYFVKARIGPVARRAGATVERLVEALQRDPAVEVAEPDYYRYPALIPNDSQFRDQWYHENTGEFGGTIDADIDTPEAWDVTTGSPSRIVVAVIDTGIDINHQDLRQNIWTNPLEFGSASGTDNDGNGLVDDDRGWNWSGNNNDVSDYTSGIAAGGHGTSVAGVIGAMANNVAGIAGTIWNVRLMSLKIFAQDENPNNIPAATVSREAQAIDYALRPAMGTPVQDRAQVITLAFGGAGASVVERDALIRAQDANVVVVTAAGNASNVLNPGADLDSSATKVYPAFHSTLQDNVISVAASDRYDRIALFSNYGRNTVDIAAPGQEIMTTWPGNLYHWVSGTSAATGLVAGAAALVRSRFPTLTAAQVKARLMATADRPAAIASRVRSGRLNVFQALQPDTTPPGDPKDVRALRRSTHALEIAWISSGDDGESGTAAAYEIRYAQVSGPSAPAPPFATMSIARRPAQPINPPKPEPSGTQQKYLLQSLQAGGYYYVAIQAIDKDGNRSSPTFGGPFQTDPNAPTYRMLFMDTAGDAVPPRPPFTAGMTGNPPNPGAVKFTGQSPWATTDCSPTQPQTDPRTTPRSYTDSPATNPPTCTRANYGTNLNISLTQNADTAVQLPPGIFPNNPAVQDLASPALFYWLATDLGPNDFLRVDVSTDLGLNWLQTNIQHTGIQAGTLVGWDITAAADRTILLRFRLQTDNVDNMNDGVWIDDIVIAAEVLQPYPGSAPPAAVSGLTARACLTSGIYNVRLQWTDNAADETGFRIVRNGVPIAVVPAAAGTGSTVSYLDDNGGAGLQPDTIYAYEVIAFNAVGNASPVAVSVRTSVPNAPLNLAGAVQPGPPLAIQLTWTDAGPDTQSFTVERQEPDGVSWRVLGTVPVPTPPPAGYSFVDDNGGAGLAPNTAYTYRVKATNCVGDSAYSDEATIVTDVPNPPSGLTARAISATSVRLDWTDNSTDETSFEIERSTDSGFGSIDPGFPVSRPPNTTTYTDSTVTMGGTYYYRVRARNAVGPSAWSNVAGVRVSPPNAPTSLTVTPAPGGLGARQLDLAWTYTRDPLAPETRFDIYRAPESAPGSGVPGTFVRIAMLAAGSSTYSDDDGGAGLSPNAPYFYRVAAHNAVGDSFFPTPPAAVSGTTRPVPPNAPGGLSASIQPGPLVRLTWTDNSTDETDWKVRRKRLGEPAFAVIATIPSTTTAGTGGTVSYDDVDDPGSPLVPDTVYEYQVIAANAVGDSIPSNTATVNFSRPAAPSGLVARGINSTQIRLTWTDNSTDETGFRIERSPDNFQDPANTVVAGAVGANATTFTDGGLTAGVTYYYRVQAVNLVGGSGYSNVASAAPIVAPAAPSNLTATPISGSAIRLAWKDNSNNESGFRIERKTGPISGPASYAQIAVVGANVQTYTSSGLASATTYSFRVRAFNAGGVSGYSNEVEATTFGPPAAPGPLTASAAPSLRIRLEWADNSTDETTWRVQRASSASGPWADIRVFSSTTTATTTAGTGAPIALVDGPFPAGTTQYYRVRAENLSGASPWSNVASGTTQGPPAAPSGLNAVALAGGRAALGWIDNSTDEDGFRIERRLGTTGAFREIAVVGANVTSYTDVGLSAGSTYYYRVRAFNAGGLSAYSNVSPAVVALRGAVRGAASAGGSEGDSALPPGRRSRAGRSGRTARAMPWRGMGRGG